MCIYVNYTLYIGARSFNRRSLHHIGDEQNPYEQAIAIIGQTLSSFDEDNLIPCFGFGDGISSRFVQPIYFPLTFLFELTVLKYVTLTVGSINS